MNSYIFTFEKEIEVDEPLYSTNNKGCYISGWIKVKRTKMYNKIFYGITNIEDFIKRRRREKPEVAIITWSPYNGPFKKEDLI